MPFADISFGLYPSFKGEAERKQKCLYRQYKRKHPLRILSLSFSLPLLPDTPCIHSSPSLAAQVACYVCRSIPGRLVEIKNACYHLADVQNVDLKNMNRPSLSSSPFRPWAFFPGSSRPPSSPWAGCLAVGASQCTVALLLTLTTDIPFHHLESSHWLSTADTKRFWFSAWHVKLWRALFLPGGTLSFPHSRHTFLQCFFSQSPMCDRSTSCTHITAPTPLLPFLICPPSLSQP